LNLRDINSIAKTMTAFAEYLNELKSDSRH